MQFAVSLFKVFFSKECVYSMRFFSLFFYQGQARSPSLSVIKSYLERSINFTLFIVCGVQNCFKQE